VTESHIADPGQELLKLFHFTSEHVPAYRKFLSVHSIDPKEIKTFEDFQKVPPVNKDNYLRKHPLEELCVNGNLKHPIVFTSTSGSTGEPFYFPREVLLNKQYSAYCKSFFDNSTNADKSTLVIVGFGMGVWIGGVITYEAFKIISENGQPLSIITPGVNKKEIFDAMRNIAPRFERVILCGYPPFIKDVLDDGKANGVDWKKHDMKLLFAAETFSETFRNYVCRKVGIADPLRDTMNIYGSADLGGMAQETPLSILIRRLALKNKKIYKRLFTEATRLPTLVQYNPAFINFESVDRSIYVSGMNTLPLVRYQIGDNGGVISFNDVEKIFADEGLDLAKETEGAGISDTVSKWPFVYVYERTDLSTKLYGAIIYPEYIKAGLQNPDLEDYVTGKFTMFTKNDKDQNEYLEVNVELQAGVGETKELRDTVIKSISTTLKEQSAEHENNSKSLGEKVEPKIIFWPHEDLTYFKPGIKQKWVKK
jgi:phenylacetate-CoA ligase